MIREKIKLCGSFIYHLYTTTPKPQFARMIPYFIKICDQKKKLQKNQICDGEPKSESVICDVNNSVMMVFQICDDESKSAMDEWARRDPWWNYEKICDESPPHWIICWWECRGWCEVDCEHLDVFIVSSYRGLCFTSIIIDESAM